MRKVILFGPQSRVTERAIPMLSHHAEIYLAGQRLGHTKLPEVAVKEARYFEPYVPNDLVAIQAYQWALAEPTSEIVALDTRDILRAAKLKQLLHQRTLEREPDRVFSDEFRLRAAIRDAGVPVPPFSMIDSVGNLVSFISEVGYPIKLRARNRAAGVMALTLHNDTELYHRLETGLSVIRENEPNLLASSVPSGSHFRLISIASTELCDRTMLLNNPNSRHTPNKLADTLRVKSTRAKISDSISRIYNRLKMELVGLIIIDFILSENEIYFDNVLTGIPNDSIADLMDRSMHIDLVKVAISMQMSRSLFTNGV